MYTYEIVLLPFIIKYSPYFFSLVEADLGNQKFIMSNLNQYRLVDVITPFGAVFWIPFLFLFALKIRMLYKKFFIYHILAFAVLYLIGAMVFNKYDALYLVFNLFQVIMIFMSLTFCLLGIKQLVK